MSADFEEHELKNLLGSAPPPRAPRGLSDRLKRQARPGQSLPRENGPALPPEPRRRRVLRGRSPVPWLLVSAGLVVLGVLGTAAFVSTGWSRMDVAQRLSTSLSQADIVVTNSDTEYRADSLALQVLRLESDHQHERSGRASSTDHAFGRIPPASARGVEFRHGTDASDPSRPRSSGGASGQSTEAARIAGEDEQSALSCLRHLRIQLGNVESVDFGRMDNTEVAIVVTHDDHGRQAQALSLDCPVFGDPVVAGPVSLSR